MVVAVAAARGCGESLIAGVGEKKARHALWVERRAVLVARLVEYRMGVVVVVLARRRGGRRGGAASWLALAGA